MVGSSVAQHKAAPSSKRRAKTSGSLVPSGSPVVPGTTAASGSRCTPLRGHRWEPLQHRAEPVSARDAETSRAARLVPAAADVLMLPAHLLALLPLKSALRCLSRDGSLAFTVTSSRPLWVALRACGAVVFGLLELDALTCGAANDRASSASLRLWCEWKTQAPAWRLTVSEALGGLSPSVVIDAPPTLTLGAVLSAWGADLVDAEVFS